MIDINCQVKKFYYINVKTYVTALFGQGFDP